jgi:hypothetical protein
MRTDAERLQECYSLASQVSHFILDRGLQPCLSLMEGGCSFTCMRPRLEEGRDVCGGGGCRFQP